MLGLNLEMTWHKECGFNPKLKEMFNIDINFAIYFISFVTICCIRDFFFYLLYFRCCFRIVCLNMNLVTVI